MAAVSQPAEQVTELLQNLNVDSQPKAGDSAEISSFLGANTSDGNVVGSASTQSAAVDVMGATGTYEGGMETGMYYTANGYVPHGYYYGGYDIGDWDDYSRHIGVDGVELQGPGVYGENGSVLYHAAGYGYTAQPFYNPYAPGAPIPAITADGQLYGPQAYPYPGHIYQHPVPPGAQFIPPASTITSEASTSAAERGSVGGDSSNGMLVNGNSVTLGPRPSYPVTLVPSPGPYGQGVLPVNAPAQGAQDVRVGYEGIRAGGPWPELAKVTEPKQRQGISQPFPIPGLSGQNPRPVHPMTHVSAGQQPRAPSGIGPVPGSLPRVYQPQVRMYSGPAVPGRGQGLGSNGLDLRGVGRSWVAVDKGKLQGRGVGAICNGNGSLDILNEQNRGPRTTRIRTQRIAPGALPLTRGHGIVNGGPDVLNVLANKEQYNRTDFVTSYDDAKFFVIKSYSEDDIHKSIKYNVWASTPNGNKKLDAAYQDAKGKAGHCPVFLFFSVNASGQFCGVAEMIGSVDFSKSVDFWQQDKWTGRFPVKWHIIKDVPNSQFRHIIIENNDNKPVTNSRDTQEVKFEQGIEMLNIFKSCTFKLSILDDFQFYDNRQKAMQEKRARQQVHQQPQQVLASQGSFEPDRRHIQEEIGFELQDGKLDEKEHVDKAANKSLSPKLSQSTGAFTEDGGKLSLKLVEKRESVAAVGAQADNLKIFNESKDADTGSIDDDSKKTIAKK
eukprot:c28849_g1_i6 orf=602-2770(-)